MNNYIAQGAGFRGDNEFLMFIQSIIGEVTQLSAIGGDSYILRGCEEAGGNVSNGWMVLNGEILPFTGGALGAEVTIDEAVENVTYLEDINPVDGQGDSKPAYFTRSARFGSDGVATFNWADIDKNPLAEIRRAVVPMGGIILYQGDVNNIPEGWELVSVLSGKVPVGFDAEDADYDAVGRTGGAKEVSLTEANMPVHNHNGTVIIPPHSHTIDADGGTTHSASGTSARRDGDSNGIINTNASNQQSIGFNTNNKGGGQAHTNMQPYIVMAYIRRIAV